MGSVPCLPVRRRCRRPQGEGELVHVRPLGQQIRGSGSPTSGRRSASPPKVVLSSTRPVGSVPHGRSPRPAHRLSRHRRGWRLASPGRPVRPAAVRRPGHVPARCRTPPRPRCPARHGQHDRHALVADRAGYEHRVTGLLGRDTQSPGCLMTPTPAVLMWQPSALPRSAGSPRTAAAAGLPSRGPWSLVDAARVCSINLIELLETFHLTERRDGGYSVLSSAR